MGEDPKCKYFFELRGLSLKDAEMFFTLMKAVTGEGEVDIALFVAGCMRMRGAASSMDLHAMSFELKVMHTRQKELSKRIDRQMSHFVEAMEGLKLTVAELKLGVAELQEEEVSPVISVNSGRPGHDRQGHW